MVDEKKRRELVKDIKEQPMSGGNVPAVPGTVEHEKMGGLREGHHGVGELVREQAGAGTATTTVPTAHVGLEGLGATAGAGVVGTSGIHTGSAGVTSTGIAPLPPTNPAMLPELGGPYAASGTTKPAQFGH